MTWLYEEPEGIEFEALPDDQKYDYAIKQSQRTDKNWVWRYVWDAIAWSHNPKHKLRRKYDPKRKGQEKSKN